MQVEKTVFISYRRTNVFHALAVYQYLKMHEFDVFLDYESIDSGSFAEIILNQIGARAHFVVILTPSALERCNEPNDWLRQEIEHAVDLKRNIVPLMFEGFKFSDVQRYLVDKLAVIAQYNAVEVPATYFEEAMNRLATRFLNKPLDIIIHPTPAGDLAVVQQATTDATKQPVVTEQQLNAEAYFERGFKKYEASDYDGAIDDFTYTLFLNPAYSDAHYWRGKARLVQGDSKNALLDWQKAASLAPQDRRINLINTLIYGTLGDLDRALVEANEGLRLNPEYAESYLRRAYVRNHQGDFDGAIDDYSRAIELNPRYTTAYYNRGGARMDKGDLAGAIADYTEAIRLTSRHVDAYRNRGLVYVKLGDLKRANADYQQYIDLGGKEAEQARRWIATNEAKMKEG